MNPINFEGSQIIGAPKNWDPEKDGECIGLPATIAVLPNGMRQFTSVWKFTDEERAHIASGGNLAISCFGAQVPIMLTVAHIDGPTVPFGRDKPAGPQKIVSNVTLQEMIREVMKGNPHKVQQAHERAHLKGWFVGQTAIILRERGYEIPAHHTLQDFVIDEFKASQPVAASET